MFIYRAKSAFSLVCLFCLSLTNSVHAQYVSHEIPFWYSTATDTGINDLPWSIARFTDIKKDKDTTSFMQSWIDDALIQRYTKNSKLKLNPHVLFAAGHNYNAGNNNFVTGGGLQLNFQHRQKIFLQAAITGYNADDFLSDSLRIHHNLMPGVLYTQQRHEGYNALNMRFRAAYRTKRFFRFEGGIDNHYAGDGYHSLMLGNNGTPHPFASLSADFWRINYMVQYNFLQDIAWPDYQHFKQKYLTTHQLNLQLHRTFQIYIWEAVVWKAEDSVTQRGFDLSYLNPVIFYRPVEFQLGFPSPDNVLMALGFRWQPVKYLRIYSQVLLDEFRLGELKNQTGWWANKFGIQAGLAAKFQKNEHHFRFLLEFNMARPFTYSHINSMQNYGSRFYPLAHPLGANFAEMLFMGNWQYSRLFAKAKMAYIASGLDSRQVNYGQNIYRTYTDRESEYDHEWLQGSYQESLTGDLQFGYVINPAMNLKISGGVRRIATLKSNCTTPAIYEEIYLRLSTFLTSGMKKLYRNRAMQY